MPEIDIGTISRMAISINKDGFTKQIKLDEADVEYFLEALKTASKKRNLVYMADGLNMFIDLDVWSRNADEWRSFLDAREERPNVTPKKAGVSSSKG